MQKLLLPADGSPSSLRAAEFAARMLRGEPSAKALLLNVQPPIMAWEISPHVTVEMVRQFHEKAGREALMAARSVLDSAGIPYEEHLLSGDPAQTIAR